MSSQFDKLLGCSHSIFWLIRITVFIFSRCGERNNFLHKKLFISSSPLKNRFSFRTFEHMFEHNFGNEMANTFEKQKSIIDNNNPFFSPYSHSHLKCKINIKNKIVDRLVKIHAIQQLQVCAHIYSFPISIQN